MKKTKKFLSFLCATCIMLILPTPAFATSSGDCMNAAYIPNVGNTSSNLRNETLDKGMFNTQISEFNYAKQSDGKLAFTGAINQIPFLINAVPYDTPANQSIQVFNADDSLGNYEVLFVAVERNLQDAALYFTNTSLSSYENVIKLYLRPISSVDFIAVEIFTSHNIAYSYFEVPISQDMDAPSIINLLWYTKVFEPKVTIEEHSDVSRIINSDAHQISYKCEFNQLGLTLTQVFVLNRYVSWPDSFKNNGVFTTAFEVEEEYIECKEKPNEGISTSSITVINPRIDIAIGAGDACSAYEIAGTVDKGASAKVNFKWKNAISLNSIASISLTYDENNPNHNLNEGVKHLTNSSDTTYYRILGVSLDSDCKLTTDGHQFSVKWTIDNFAGSKTSQTFKARFTYTMMNKLNYSPWSTEQIFNTSCSYKTIA